MNFQKAVDKIIEFEGGYVNHPRDPGGETKYGISKRAFPQVDIPNLTIELAKDIYKLHFWDMVKADELPEAIRLIVFDCAVNQGVRSAVRILQSIVGVERDGIIGPETLRRANETEPVVLLHSYALLRHDHYTNLVSWATFGKGWSKRLLEVVLESID